MVGCPLWAVAAAALARVGGARTVELGWSRDEGAWAPAVAAPCRADHHRLKSGKTHYTCKCAAGRRVDRRSPALHIRGTHAIGSP